VVRQQARDAGALEQPSLWLAQDDRDLRGPMGQGTSFQRSLSIQARNATNVSTLDSGATRSSFRYPATSRPSTTPAVY
jgi:hypothetical protein